MRWILVFLFLYLIPLVILFKNYNNFRRSCMYSSMYIVVVSTIVITNVYISGLNKIREAMYYQNYAFDRRYSDKYASNFDKDFESETQSIDRKENKNSVNEVETSKKIKNEIEENKEEDKVTMNYEENSESIQNSDKELIYNFKKEVYEIESIALIPMRDCMPYTKNISENIKHLSDIREKVEYAKDMCDDVINTYNSMEIPTLSNKEYTKVVDNSRNDVKIAYELRKKAMEYSIKLIDTKNPKYIGKITEYLNLSDKHIASFKQRLSDLNDKIDKQETLYN